MGALIVLGHALAVTQNLVDRARDLTAGVAALDLTRRAVDDDTSTKSRDGVAGQVSGSRSADTVTRERGGSDGTRTETERKSTRTKGGDTDMTRVVSGSGSIDNALDLVVAERAWDNLGQTETAEFGAPALGGAGAVVVKFGACRESLGLGRARNLRQC